MMWVLRRSGVCVSDSEVAASSQQRPTLSAGGQGQALGSADPRRFVKTPGGPSATDNAYSVASWFRWSLRLTRSCFSSSRHTFYRRQAADGVRAATS